MLRFRVVAASTVLFVLIPVLCYAARPAVPTPPTQALLEQYEGLRVMVQGDRALALFGVPFAYSTGTQTTAEFVDAWLAANADALGVDGVELVLEDDVFIKGGAFQVFSYSQVYTQIPGETLPVDGTVVKLKVLVGDPPASLHEIGYIGMRLVHPYPLVTQGEITAAQAIAVVQAAPSYDQLVGFSDPLEADKVIYEDEDDGLHRAWRFMGWGGGEGYLFFVDTTSAGIVGAIPLVDDVDISGAVTGWVSHGTEAPPGPFGNSQIRYAGFPHATVNIMPSDYVCESGEGTPSQTEAAGVDGEYSFTNVDAGDRVVGRLDNGFLAIWDYEGSYWPVTVENPYPDPADGGHVAEVCEVVPGSPGDPIDLVFNDNQGQGYVEWEMAVANAYLAATNTHDWYQMADPSALELDDPNLPVVVNLAYAGCLALHSLVPYQHLRFGVAYEDEPVSCFNAAFSTVVSHEYGHVIMYRLLPWFRKDTPDKYSFAEGFADTTAALHWNTACLAEGWKYGDNRPRCLRNAAAAMYGEDATNEDIRYCGWYASSCSEGGFECEVQLYDDRCTPGGVGGGCSCHIAAKYCRSLAMTQAYWDLRPLLWDWTPSGGKDHDWRVEELFAAHLRLTTRASVDPWLIHEVLIANDNNSNLWDGTPDWDAIVEAFGRHGWTEPTPENGIEVRWRGPVDGQGYPTIPEVGVDYVVTEGVVPPSVTLITTEKDGRPVYRWYIWNRFLGIRGIGAAWDELSSNNIVVQVGHPSDENMQCQNLNGIDIPTQGGDAWSSVELYLTGDLSGLARCYANSSGEGGRISGEIGGAPGWIEAHSIGVGAGVQPLDAGSLIVERTLGSIELETINLAESEVRVANLEDVVDILGEHHGIIRVTGDLNTGGAIDVHGTGNSSGKIVIDGSVHPYQLFWWNPGPSIYVAGNMSGDILVGADITNAPHMTGPINARVTIDGEMSGDVVVGGNIAGDLTVGSAMSGNILVDGEISSNAQVTIDGDMSGDILADADEDSEGDITGDVTVEYPYEFSGNICAANLSPRLFPLPSNIQMTLTPGEARVCDALYCDDSADNCPIDVVACSVTATCAADGFCDWSDDGNCALQPNPATAHPHSVAKNRYISFVPNNDEAVAIKIERQDGASWDTLGWLDEPDVNNVSRIIPDPAYHREGGWDAFDVIHVTGCEIEPGLTYGLSTTWDDERFSTVLSISTVAVWGDIVGAYSEGQPWDPPDGEVIIDDILAVIAAFQSKEYSQVTWADVALAEPEYEINIDDILAIIGAFQSKPYPVLFECGVVPPPSGPVTQFTLVADTDLIEQSELVSVDVFIDAADDLAACQVSLVVTGGDMGSLDLEELILDDQRQDYVFGEATKYPIHDLERERFATAKASGSVDVTESAYLGTFTFRASQDASGVFMVSVRGGEYSKLLDEDAARIATDAGEGVLIGCEVECVDDSHCNDTNICTYDTCIDTVCVYDPKPFGTSCNDRLWCTVVDECDGQGTCVGSGLPCRTFPQVCCESLKTCIGPEERCP